MRETVFKDDGRVIRSLLPDCIKLAQAWRLVYYPPGARMSMHRHDIAQFSVVLSGCARETTHQGDYDSRAMGMEFKPANFQHANTFGPDGALLLSINLNPDMSDMRDYIHTQEWQIRAGADIRREWTLLARKIAMSNDTDEDELETATADLLVAFMQTEDKPNASSPPGWLLRAYEAIIETDKSIEAIARDAGVHRVHLSRSFRRYFDCSIIERRRQARLSRAIRHLAQHGAPASIACYAAGFADQSHLTRTMQQQTGLTPKVLGNLFRH
jgi:AraC family transcriptional regulator